MQRHRATGPEAPAMRRNAPGVHPDGRVPAAICLPAAPRKTCPTQRQGWMDGTWAAPGTQVNGATTWQVRSDPLVQGAHAARLCAVEQTTASLIFAHAPHHLMPGLAGKATGEVGSVEVTYNATICIAHSAIHQSASGRSDPKIANQTLLGTSTAKVSAGPSLAYDFSEDTLNAHHRARTPLRQPGWPRAGCPPAPAARPGRSGDRSPAPWP